MRINDLTDLQIDIACEGAAQLGEVINLNADATNPLALLRTRRDGQAAAALASSVYEFASFHRITSRQAKRS